MFNKETTVVPLPIGEFNQMREDISFLRRNISTILKAAPVEQTEWISRKEFMATCAIGSTMFNTLKNEDKLHLNYVNRKCYVHRSCVEKYFSGAFSKTPPRLH